MKKLNKENGSFVNMQEGLFGAGVNTIRKCKHEKGFKRIGVLKDMIYSETEEKCTECGYIREIGKDGWKDEKEKETK